MADHRQRPDRQEEQESGRCHFRIGALLGELAEVGGEDQLDRDRDQVVEREQGR